ncbi:MAG: hypothetical protein ONB16_02085 [candidate division KSB1 bacterium]|nr:hypothetical protein [candidate division KSB1 bacterium]MDZ7340134.1 hypothetical protein [candidate division KSB1 bacterium]
MKDKFKFNVKKIIAKNQEKNLVLLILQSVASHNLLHANPEGHGSGIGFVSLSGKNTGGEEKAKQALVIR